MWMDDGDEQREIEVEEAGFKKFQTFFKKIVAFVILNPSFFFFTVYFLICEGLRS